MTQRPFGSTGLRVSALGFDAGHIGNPAMPERDVAALLNATLDAGMHAVAAMHKGALAPDHASTLRDAFARHGGNWRGET